MEWLVEGLVSTKDFKKKKINIHQRNKMGMKKNKRTVKAKASRKWRDGTQNIQSDYTGKNILHCKNKLSIKKCLAIIFLNIQALTMWFLTFFGSCTAPLPLRIWSVLWIISPLKYSYRYSDKTRNFAESCSPSCVIHMQVWLLLFFLLFN